MVRDWESAGLEPIDSIPPVYTQQLVEETEFGHYGVGSSRKLGRLKFTRTRGMSRFTTRVNHTPRDSHGHVV